MYSCVMLAAACFAFAQLGYPVMVRPSYVLGGRAMEIVYSDEDIHRYINTAVEVDPERPVLVDKYLDRADELDVDALADKDGNVVICGIMQARGQAVCLNARIDGQCTCRRILLQVGSHDARAHLLLHLPLQHIEQAGVHSGDSACSIPPQTISAECLATIRDWTPKLAKALKVVGLINIQYAVQDNQVRFAPSKHVAGGS